MAISDRALETPQHSFYCIPLVKSKSLNVNPDLRIEDLDPPLSWRNVKELEDMF